MGRWEAEVRYEEFREVAREVALRYVRSMPIWASEEERLLVRLTEIDEPCLDIWEATWKTKMFNWREVDAHFKRDTDRFEVAIWSGEELCGLCAGRSSNGPDNVTIHFLERMRPDNPLRGRIALLATETADRYAKTMQKQRVKLKDPLADAIVVYEALRFVLAEPLGQTTYYARQVG
jgi:uncharacterized protein YdcH (DUF465 family)